MNVFCATGNIGSDAEVRYIQSGTAVANFSLAVKCGYGDKSTTLWVRCNLWGKRAEGNLVQYLKKGTQIAVSGELSEREWQGQSGETRKSLELRINTIDLVGQKRQVASDQKADFQAPQGGDPFPGDIPF